MWLTICEHEISISDQSFLQTSFLKFAYKSQLTILQDIIYTHSIFIVRKLNLT